MLSYKLKRPKIAIAHDFLTYFGGAEQVLRSLHNLYPEAPIYTLLYDKDEVERHFPKARIKSSFLGRLPRLARKKKYLLPFFSVAAETFDLRDFNVVISSSSSFAKGVITKLKTIHICYCHTPTRFLWDWHYNYLEENKIKGLKKMLVLPVLHYLRMWDKCAADRVDYFIANSQNTADRIKKFYKKDSKVIYPPVDVDKFRGQDLEFEANNRGDYFLIVSRLSPYKRVNVAVEAFNKLELPLLIIGEGKEKKRLERIAEKNIKFLGFQPEEKLAQYYQNCQALIFPSEDDFGITPVEAMSFGKPVLAYRKGGALETVVEGVTGEFFDDPTAEVLADGVRRIRDNYKNYDSRVIKRHARKFSRERFEKEIKEFIDSIVLERLE